MYAVSGEVLGTGLRKCTRRVNEVMGHTRRACT